ncbi:MAG: zf-HC2 domain-containing protein [Acidobacteria bacterium]|nr:zf-HC2 domain-containing protein [Acidobacteriota bacterium]
MLTCKDFLHELNEYLDETTDPEIRRRVEEHISECPNCWVVHNTAQKTLKIFKGMEPQELPADVHSRLMAALEKKRAKGKPPSNPA